MKKECGPIIVSLPLTVIMEGVRVQKLEAVGAHEIPKEMVWIWDDLLPNEVACQRRKIVMDQQVTPQVYPGTNITDHLAYGRKNVPEKPSADDQFEYTCIREESVCLSVCPP